MRGKGDEVFPECFLTDQGLVAKTLGAEGMTGESHCLRSERGKEWNMKWLHNDLPLCYFGTTTKQLISAHSQRRPLLAVDSFVLIIIQARCWSVPTLPERNATLSRGHDSRSECGLNDSDASSAFVSLFRLFLQTPRLCNRLNLCHRNDWRMTSSILYASLGPPVVYFWPVTPARGGN